MAKKEISDREALEFWIEYVDSRLPPRFPAASSIAAVAHIGQMTETGELYFSYLLEIAKLALEEMGHIRPRVASDRLVSYSLEDALQVTAVLHAAIDRTSLTLADLHRLKYPTEVVGAIGCLMVRPEEDFAMRLERVQSHPIASGVYISVLRLQLKETLADGNQALYECAINILRGQVAA